MEQIIYDYVVANYKHAEKAFERFGVSPKASLSQGAMESDWGRSGIAKKANNLFGMTAFGKPNEFWNGEYITASTGLKFRKYTSVENSFMDFARLISTNYKAAASVSNDVAKYAKAIAYSPYISEINGDNRPNYENGIIARYNAIVTTFLKKKLTLPLLGIVPVVK